MKLLCLIPARGGSKGIPGKNIKLLCGRPLLGYTIETALQVVAEEDICVSTDSEQIRNVAESFGISVPFLRPAELSTDESGSHELILHALDFFADRGVDYQSVALLQPTSPFRKDVHLREALALYNPHVDMIVSVCESSLNPYFNLFEEGLDGFLYRCKPGGSQRRQDCPKVYAYNGAIYIINARSIRQTPLHELKKVVKYVMDDVSSIDIDAPFHWILAETIIQQRNAANR